MRNRNSLSKTNKALLMIAVLHWVLTFFTDHIIFSYVMWDFSDGTQMIKTAMTYGAKAVFLLVLLGIYQGLYRFFTTADRRFVKYTLIYFALNMALLFLTWPGIWRMDEFGILNSATLLLPVFWQNYLTSLFYVFSLMLVPVPSGVIIVQCALISLMAGYIINFFVKRFGKTGLAAFIPCLFFPVLDSNLYPMRMSLYGFMELFLLVLLFERILHSVSSMGFICVLAALVTVWRTEAVYYFILFPLLLLILFMKKWDKKCLIRVICGYLVCALCLFVPQTVGDKLTSGNQYDLTSVVLPLVPLVNEAYGREDCEEQLAAIDKVVNVEIAVEGARQGRSGISLFWGEPEFQREYSDEEYGAFKSAYYALVMKFPAVFLEERFDCFLHSTDLLQNTTELFSAEGVPNYDTFAKYPGSKPVSEKLRNCVIQVLEWRSLKDYEYKKTGYGIVYSGLLPVCIILFVWLLSLLKRKWKAFFLLSLPLVKVPLVFLTAPSRLFMYYYPLYLIGYFLAVYVVLVLFGKLWKKAGGPVQKTIAYAKRNGIKAAYDSVRERLDKTHRDEMSRLAADYRGCREWSLFLPEKEQQQERKRQEGKSFPYEPLVSIVVPAYETHEEFLGELLCSVMGQTYANWELIVADGSESRKVKDIVEEKCGKDSRIHYKKLEENKGISQNTNRAVEAAKGDYIALLDHDDILTRDALYFMVERLNEAGGKEKVLAVYSDEDKCDGRAERFYEPHFKPDFNMDLLLSNNYICHFLMVRASEMKELRLRGEFDGAQDYDLVLRLGARCIGRDAGKNRILHVSRVLYHWRCHEGSTAGNTESKRYAYDAGRRALEEYYRAMGMEDLVKVRDSLHLGFYDREYVPDIFTVRKDVAAVCGRVVRKGVVIGGPKLSPGAGKEENASSFKGLLKNNSGYMHRAALYLEAAEGDERAIRLRPGLECSLEEALESGMKLIYDPSFIVEIQ